MPTVWSSPLSTALALYNVLEQAAQNDVKIISYDRLIVNTPHVSYYATFDNFQVGVIQATSIVEGLDLKNNAGPFNIELFGGFSRRYQRLLLLGRAP